MGPVALAFWSPTATLGQFCIGRSFIKEYQPWQGSVEEWAAAVDPQITSLSYLNSLPFAGQKAFFYG